MDLRNIRHFLAVAETLNYSRAAERLMMAASPLSRSIQQLELEIGGSLFSRGTRKVELTPLGEALIPYAERTLADMEALKREMARRVLGHPELRVGMRSLPMELLNAVVDEVIKTVESDAVVRLEPLDSFTQMEQILSGRLALGLLNRRSEDRRLDYLPVLSERSGIALPDRPEYAQLETVRPEDLVGLRLLAQSGVDVNAPQLTAFREAVMDVVPVTSDIIGGMSAMIAAGDSCCLTLMNPGAPWHRYLASEGVIIRPLAGAARNVTYLAWRTDRDVDDDLGPILAAARERFSAPLDR